MPDHAAIIHVHHDGALARIVHLRSHSGRACRNSNIDFLYHDAERIDIGSIRLFLDSGPVPRWACGHLDSQTRMEIIRATTKASIGCPMGTATAKQGDVLTIARRHHPTYTFTLVEIVPVDSDRGAIITLLGLADEKHGATEGELLRNVAERFARIIP